MDRASDRSMEFQWQIPQSCMPGGSVIEDDIRAGPCENSETFDLASGKPVFSAPSADDPDDDGDEVTWAPPGDVHGATIGGLAPATQYCLGFFVETSLGQRLGPFIGAGKTWLAGPYVVKSTPTIEGRPEFEFKYDLNIQLHIVQVSTNTPHLQEYLNVVRSDLSATPVSRLYQTDKSAYAFVEAATATFHYDLERLVAAGIDPSQLVVLGSEPSDAIYRKLDHPRFDPENHTVSGDVSGLYCGPPEAKGPRNLCSTFGLFVLKGAPK